MIDTAVTLDTSFEDYSKSEWMDAVKQVAQNGGFYEALGSRHHAMFLEKSSTLLVSFETINGMRALSSMAHPLGWEMVRSEGWSHLCLASEGDTWFRDAPVYAFFDRLIDDGFSTALTAWSFMARVRAVMRLRHSLSRHRGRRSLPSSRKRRWTPA